MIQQSTERSTATRHASSSQSDVSKSAGSLSPTSSTTSQLTEKHYFVPGVERTAESASQQTQSTFSMSPPLSHRTASTTSPPPSTEEPFQMRSSSSSTSKDADRKVVETSRQTKASRQADSHEMETANDVARDFVDDNVNLSQTSSSNVATPGLVHSDFYLVQSFFLWLFAGLLGDREAATL